MGLLLKMRKLPVTDWTCQRKLSHLSFTLPHTHTPTSHTHTHTHFSRSHTRPCISIFPFSGKGLLECSTILADHIPSKQSHIPSRTHARTHARTHTQEFNI